MKSRYIIFIASISMLLILIGCGKKAENAVESPYSLDFRCAVNGYEFSLEYKDVKKMREQGTAELSEDGSLKVTCPDCGKMEASDADPRLWPPKGR